MDTRSTYQMQPHLHCLLCLTGPALSSVCLSNSLVDFFSLETRVLQFWEIFLNYLFDYFLPSIFSISRISTFRMLDLPSCSSNFHFYFLPLLPSPSLWFRSAKFPRIYLPVLLLSFPFLPPDYVLISKSSIL